MASGAVLATARGIGPRGRMQAIDLSENMLAVAARNLRRAILDKLTSSGGMPSGRAMSISNPGTWPLSRRDDFTIRSASI